ncbi:cellulose synthase-like protein E6 isoform X1 [Amaranthus tricolor]|uniref:cellulose synthase-like protein E6 isoform X1 n=2 Tax=Amaranthus tricolor TaxID=29722 RepID=UPI00258947A0|nr:cellulose synthase-like protein E6 isoform X1 [Amaranthus tricolor]XP_057515797.1 cellulose synthase-like protein E6 isoform X1 [Amaranthus tricolor]XP_057515798.1 cellulose synthase-like protein E6 isoform X1 [Amaranthus tricolor]
MENDEEYQSLFETKKAKGRLINKLFAGSILISIIVVWVYRITHIRSKDDEGRWVWVGLFVAEIWFTFYWILTQVLRWNLVFRTTFKDRLSLRYENELPKVDIFVCTADPVREPPIMVINTVLSVMAYNYPPNKLTIYLSDDACSILTFYSLFEASKFSKYWLPYCRKFNVEPRSPLVYFASMDTNHSTNFVQIKKIYEEMQKRIEESIKIGRIPEVYDQHKGFLQWKSSFSSKIDHDTILQILIDNRDSKAKDVEGCTLPTLVYLAREKRPQHFHNFKAGAMNALIRISSKISNAPIILNVDCDMYSNNSQSIRDALCFFMDEKKSQGIAFVQFPQVFENITKNNIYGASIRVIQQVELPGMDALGGAFYIGTGCFHQREILYGRKYSKDYKFEWNMQNGIYVEGKVDELEDKAKGLASCTYEMNTQWGKEMGLKYGCAIEDILTGLGIHCRGWKSVMMNPERRAFLGVAPITLIDSLIQHNRWTAGWVEIMLYHSSLLFQLARLRFGLFLGYLHYNFWAFNCFATFYYCIIPSLYMLKGTSLFPEISSTWFLPFGYIIIAKNSYSLGEYLHCGSTLLGWWNEQRMWLYKRTTSYLLAIIDTILKLLGFSSMKFVITSKITDKNVSKRYENDIMEFGVDSSMFVILESIALLNLFTFLAMVKKVMMGMKNEREMLIDKLALQIVLCGVLVLINLPLYGSVLRNDKGKMPIFVTIKAIFIALFICILFLMF